MYKFKNVNMKKLISVVLSIMMVINILMVQSSVVLAIDKTKETYKYDNYKIDYNIVSSWGSTQNISVTITNTGTKPIENWALSYNLNGDVENIWNAKVVELNDHKYIKNMEYNSDIMPNKSVNFGYTLANAGNIPDSITTCQARVEKDSGYTVDLKITSDWGSGFNGEIIIKNTSEQPIENWELTFDSNFKISNSWAATITNSDMGRYTLKGTYNKVIKPNSSISLGFGGVKGKDANISNVALSEVILQPEVKTPIEPEDIDLEIDSDNDGLVDVYEKLLGTDPYNSDSDSDGLPDEYEVYKLDTDPTMFDTYSTGKSDAEYDSDNDGLTNYDEYKRNTNPLSADTDDDGLSDWDEIFVYGTDPLNVDTDKDSIYDGDEIKLGLDPTKEMSDKITHDSMRTFLQTLPNDCISEELLLSDNWLTPSVSGKVTDVISNHLRIDSSSLDIFDDNRALVSDVIEIETTYKSPLTLTFQLSSTEYSKDMRNLVVAKYNEDILPFETVISTDNNSISAEIEGSGTYFVLDLDEFLKSVGIDVLGNISTPVKSDFTLKSFAYSDTSELESFNNEINSSISEYIDIYDNYGNIIDSIPNVETISTENIDDIMLKTQKSNILSMTPMTLATTQSKAMGKADIVFVIDKTGSMGGAINNVRNNISKFADALINEYNIDANFALIEFQDITYDGINSTILHKSGTSNWFTDINKFKAEINSLQPDNGGDYEETPIDGLEMARRLDFRNNANRFVVLVTDASHKNNNNYGVRDLTHMTDLFVNDNVVVSVISQDTFNYSKLNTLTGGMWGYIYGDFSVNLLKLADKVAQVTNDGEWILLDDYQAVKLNAPLSENIDTDEDGVRDGDELNKLTIKDMSKFIEILLNNLSIPKNQYIGKSTITVCSYFSNPVLSDTDFDGINDNKDTSKRSNNFKGVLHYERNENKLKSNIEFTVDYREFFKNNEIYNDKLAVLTSLFMADIYKNVYVEVTNGTTGGSDEDSTALGSLFGLSDVEDINLNADDYSVDKDDISEIVIGHRLVEYGGVKKEIIVLSVRGTNGTSAEWSSNFDVGANTDEYYNATGEYHPDWLDREYHHKGFDVASNRIINKVDEYLKRHKIDNSANKTIIITGHSRGGAIANLLGKYFDDRNDFTSFTYTFAGANVTTNPNASKYKTIYNIINEDDLIPFMPLEDWHFTKYGKPKSVSVEKKYENKFGMAKEGTWEWLVGYDYDNDGGTQRTIKTFSKLAENRKELYKLDNSSDGKVWENNVGHITKQGAEDEKVKLTQILKDEKLLPYCKLSVVGSGLSYHVEVNYCPAYLMQTLANMATKVGPTLGHDVKGKYASAKASFIATSGFVKVKGVGIGGLTDPHLQITYYLIAHNKFANN